MFGKMAFIRGRPWWLARTSSCCLVAVLCTALIGCGSGAPQQSSAKRQGSAEVPTSCKAGQTLIAGHFRGQYCVTRDEAGAALACSEAQYELDLASDIRAPQPAALHSVFVQAVKESAAIINRTEKAVSASRAPSAAGDLEWLARHRARVLNDEREAETAGGVPVDLNRWFQPLLAHDLACEHHTSRALR